MDDVTALLRDAAEATGLSLDPNERDWNLLWMQMATHPPLRRAIEGSGGCPAARHHRVRTFQKGGIIGTTDDGEDFVLAPDALVADRCTACGRDFLAALPRPEEGRR